jgi:hypothetical protein
LVAWCLPSQPPAHVQEVHDGYGHMAGVRRLCLRLKLTVAALVGTGGCLRWLGGRSVSLFAAGFSTCCGDGRALHRWAEAVSPIARHRAGIQHRIDQAQQLHPHGRLFGRRSSSESNARLPIGAENGNIIGTSHLVVTSPFS